MSVYAENLDLDLLQYQILSEAYIGKTSTMLEIEKQVGVIRKKALKKFTDINRSPEVLQLNRLFEKQFGMDCFALYIEQNNTINAYTMPVSLNFDVAKNINLSKMVYANQSEGYRFKEGNNLCIICNVYLGLIKNPDITDAEIVAVMLHELGHNFADCIYKRIYVANQNMMLSYYKTLIWTNILTLGLALPFTLPTLLKFNNKRKKKTNSKTRKRNIRGLFKGLKATYDDINDYINEIMSRLQGTDIKAYLDQVKDRLNDKGVPEKTRKSLGRQNEVIADKFAGIYGYGPEQASALMKMELAFANSKAAQYAMRKNKIANDDFEDAYRDIYKYDEHPHIIQRLNEEIKTLEYELSKANIDPKLIEAMKGQIEQLKALRTQMITVNDEMNSDDRKRAEFYNNVNNEDPDAIDQDLEDSICAAFDDVFEN